LHVAEQDRLREVAVGAALAAGQLLRHHFGRPQQVEHKGEIDLVTALDRQAEATIVERIRAVFPDHAVLAEEDTWGDARGEHRWVIDPLDGTTNYAHGYPVFCVSVAYEHAGHVVLGVVYDPLREELFLGEAGGGASLNGRPLRVSATANLRESLLITGFPYDRAQFPHVVRLLGALLDRSQGVRRSGAAALDLCYVAAGRADGYWERFVRPWDVAAGTLIVAAAGGRVTDFRGGPFDVHCGEAVATNGTIHDELLGGLAAAGG